jgi:hypothetical protein
VQHRVDVIVTAGTPPTVAAAKVTTTIPIVFWSVGDPVGQKLVNSLAHPGRNLTGTGALGPLQAVKTLEILKEAFPKSSRIAMFFNDAFPLLVSQRPQVNAAARRLGVELTEIQVRGPEDIEGAFATVARGKFGFERPALGLGQDGVRRPHVETQEAERRQIAHRQHSLKVRARHRGRCQQQRRDEAQSQTRAIHSLLPSLELTMMKL